MRSGGTVRIPGRRENSTRTRVRRADGGRRPGSSENPQGAQKAHHAPVNYVKLEGSPLGSSSSSKRDNFYCYTFQIAIYSEKKYRGHLKRKAHCLKLFAVKKVLRHRGRTPPSLVYQPRRRSG